MTTTVQIPEVTMLGRPESLYFVEVLRSGQPRAYADDEYVVRVHMFSFGWKGENPLPYGSTWGDEHDDDVVNRALSVAGMNHIPRKCPVNNIDEYFRGWIDYAKKVAPGVVEIRKVSPYCD